MQMHEEDPAGREDPDPQEEAEKMTNELKAERVSSQF